MSAAKSGKPAPVPALDAIEGRILVVRGQKVMLDADLAALYGASTKRLNEQVRRNLERFPGDFMFQLTNQELAILRSQFATSSSQLQRPAWGGRRTAPYAFTEHGAIMAATVLNSPRAIEVSVYVVRAFVRLREMIAANKELAKKLQELERRLDTHDQAITEILHAIRQLMAPPETVEHYNRGRPHTLWVQACRTLRRNLWWSRSLKSRHRLVAGTLVLAKSLLGGLHHEYSLAVGPASG